ncbi:MATH domain and coiled-coil domain-containing protein At3g58360-like [Vigna radiata var. radiata]|uniref:MATH domain and coiled-coil domain-containing protein At3g58360-like n=1 Tax=Vigna radiata var. radiata TaxID=3916 RepID=A0A3Q0FDA0_VIGRR|nr:MATH domain and coiled-coil domain-containing protein At3g58360-like [Vigna radiata var. radiata]
MENYKERPKLIFEKYTWRINNFSKLKCEEHYSESFILNGFPWYMVSCLVGGILGIYLEADKNCAYLPKDWKRTENISLALINQVNDQKTIRKGSECEFSTDDPFSKYFMFFNGLDEPSSGFIVNDTCIIEAGIFLIKNVYENELYHTPRMFDKNANPKNPLFHEMFMRSFTNINLNYVPLLEKVKDMDNEACNYYKKIWDEVKIFGFDLSWIESEFKSASNLKSYMENAAKVRKAKVIMNDLETRTEKLKEAVIETETELEMAKRDFERAKEGFEESNLDEGSLF